MKIYLAGALTGNLNSFFKEAMKIYLAGTSSRPEILKRAMKIYLAGGNIGYKWSGDYNDLIQEYAPCILESFFYIEKHPRWMKLMHPFISDFMLDSGAFTYLAGSEAGNVDWDEYIDRYAEFIIEHDVDLFLELDIDPIVGLKEVERLRSKLEDKVGKKCIPVWHKGRGLGYWDDMTKEYDYVAIGGIVTKEIKRSEHDVFYPLLQRAAENKCKVHGLGYTNSEGLKKYKFHSVDSTAWLHGNRGGFLYQFIGNEMKQIKPKENKRLKGGGRLAAAHNFNEWVKYAKYAEQNL